MTKKRKPSAVQRLILRRMLDGWELGLYGGLEAHVRIQQGGLGRGGQAETVHLNTFYSLHKNAWIEVAKDSYPVSPYRLTNLGRLVARES